MSVLCVGRGLLIDFYSGNYLKGRRGGILLVHMNLLFPLGTILLFYGDYGLLLLV